MKEMTLTAINATDNAFQTIALTPSSESTISSLSLFSNVVPAFLLIVSLILGLAWLVKRTGLKKFSSELIRVRSSYALSAKERIVLIEVAGRLMVVGITTHHMTLLDTMDEETTRKLLEKETPTITAKNSTPHFSELLKAALKRGQ